jgi:hypothetical protein
MFNLSNERATLSDYYNALICLDVVGIFSKAGESVWKEWRKTASLMAENRRLMGVKYQRAPGAGIFSFYRKTSPLSGFGDPFSAAQCTCMSDSTVKGSPLSMQ